MTCMKWMGKIMITNYYENKIILSQILNRLKPTENAQIVCLSSLFFFLIVFFKIIFNKAV